MFGMHCRVLLISNVSDEHGRQEDVQRSLDALRHQSLARKNLKAQNQGLGRGFAGRMAHWKNMQEKLADAVLKSAIDSTKAWFSIWMSTGLTSECILRKTFSTSFHPSCSASLWLVNPSSTSADVLVA